MIEVGALGTVLAQPVPLQRALIGGSCSQAPLGGLLGTWRVASAVFFQ